MNLLLDDSEDENAAAPNLHISLITTSVLRTRGGSLPCKEPNIEKDFEAGHTRIPRDYFGHLIATSLDHYIKVQSILTKSLSADLERSALYLIIFIVINVI